MGSFMVHAYNQILIKIDQNCGFCSTKQQFLLQNICFSGKKDQESFLWQKMICKIVAGEKKINFDSKKTTTRDFYWRHFRTHK